MSTLSSANVTDVNLVLKERTHVRLCLNMLIFTHNLGNWLIVPLWCDLDAQNNVTRSMSVIYEWFEDAERQGQGRFKDIQSIEVIGARDWTHFTVDSYHFLVVASARSEPSTTSLSSSSSSILSGQQYSVIYFWDSGRFIPFQTIEVRSSSFRT